MNTSSPKPSTARRKWLFRLLAVLIGLAPFLLGELALRAIGWRPVVPAGDPFVDFQNVRPLFVASDDGTQMVTAPERLASGFFQPESFAAEKPSGEFRIVCLGGSTVQGRPYAIETSFTTWLELSLQAADPDRQWEVINCGAVSYASYRLVPILEEMLRHEPDLIILYTGHNEFLEDRSYAAIKRAPQVAASAYQGLAQLRSLQLLHQLARGEPADANGPQREVLPEEVDALLDYRGGLADYSRDSLDRDAVVKHFDYNLRRMIHLANEANVSVMLVDPPKNLRDCPPFKSEHTAGISQNELKRAGEYLAKARALVGSDPQRSIGLMEQAVELNPAHAGWQYQLGSLTRKAGRFEEAKRHSLAANDEDICPLRAIEPLHRVIRQAAADADCPLLELRAKFAALSEGGIPGDNLFLDHVHPTIGGHQMIAEEIMAMLAEIGIVAPRDGWQAERRRLYDQHWDTLDLVYFETGKQRLRGLRLWSSGRAKKLRGESVDPSETPEKVSSPAVELPKEVDVERWHRPADLSQPIAQFKTVFWDLDDSDTLRPMLRSELRGSHKSVLEIGTGTGLLALICLESGAESVVATDINPAAVANARYNAERMGLSDSLDVRLVPLGDSGAFSMIGSTEKFDLIVSNPPWEDQPPEAIGEFALYDPAFQLLDSLLKDLRNHLNPGGKALLAYGSREGIEQVQRTAEKYHLQTRIRDDRDLEQLPAVFVPAVVIEVFR